MVININQKKLEDEIEAVEAVLEAIPLSEEDVNNLTEHVQSLKQKLEEYDE